MNVTKSYQHISILGCGWLGLSLAAHLIKNKFKVKGTTRSVNKLDEISVQGVQPHLIDLNLLNPGLLADFLDTQVLIFNIPPSKIDLKNLELFIEFVNQSNLQSVIFISSTGIYADSNSLINEENGTDFLNKSSQSYLIENAFKSACKKALTILQLGGLIGEGRMPDKFINSQKVLSNPNGRINFIHREDVISIIEKIIAEKITNETFICCADLHPTKKEFYTKLATQSNLPIPQFNFIENDTFKIMSSEKIKRKLNFEFRDITKP